MTKTQYFEKIIELIDKGYSFLLIKNHFQTEEGDYFAEREFEVSYRDALEHSRRKVISSPKEVFWQHIMRYDKEIVAHFDVSEVKEPYYDEESKRFINPLEIRIKGLLSPLLRFMRQKEDLLGFHKSNLKYILRDSILKKRELDEMENGESKRFDIEILSDKEQIRLLELLNKAYVGTVEVLPVQQTALEQLLLDEEKKQQWPEPHTTLPLPEKTIYQESKTPYEIAEILRQNQLQAAKEAFEVKK